MEPNFQGDLTDILRASSGSSSNSNSNAATTSSYGDILLPLPTTFSDETLVAGDAFGDPFSNTRDPLLHNTPATTFGGFYAGDGATFSRMLQISPIAGVPKSAAEIKAGDTACDAGGLQISSPRNPASIKRRKSQAKKVVCIPAPAAANSRASGEVVPSDLWAWRKYGQKPIKGSPYPRGYYRCSSSKGCSARKQVERSRTDPNMLVITYTSEHNHPWPTQRNALAGSTRSQPTKTSSSNASSKSSPNIASPKGERKSEILMSLSNNASTSTTSASVKEENVDHDSRDDQKQLLESLDDSAFSGKVGFGFTPAISNANDQDFFADLGEIEADPLNLLFAQAGFSSPTDLHSKDKNNNDINTNSNGEINKGLDPFSLFDWSEGNSQRE